MNKHANAAARRGNPRVTSMQRYRNRERARRAYAQLLDLGMPRVHLLVFGAESFTRDVVAALRPHLREPVISWQERERLRLPRAHAGTLILRDAGTLGRVDQQRLVEWLNDGATVQVVSTTSRSLLPAVESGDFSATLYYRLNMVVIDAGE